MSTNVSAGFRDGRCFDKTCTHVWANSASVLGAGKTIEESRTRVDWFFKRRSHGCALDSEVLNSSSLVSTNVLSMELSIVASQEEETNNGESWQAQMQ